ncbi:MAG TPA: M23 family metallopeptidase [Vicinamibacteria bacterium]
MVLLLLPLLLAAAPPCDPAVVRLAAPSAAQGSVVPLEAAGPVRATWGGRPLPFWREGKEGPYRALLGVDLERAPGAAAVEVAPAAGPACQAALQVTAGAFPEKQLRVGERYVELSARDQARARREAERLQAVYARVSDRLWQGAFRLPVDVDPSPNFGQRRILNGQPRSPHAGVDFGARRGTPVVAPARGRVVLAEPLFFSGRTVILDHGLGLFSLYGHLSTLSVKVGQRVETGTPLGAVGATGRATGPHLHWAVRLGGARVDPLALVRGGE